jgi:hypothetical protein
MDSDADLVNGNRRKRRKNTLPVMTKVWDMIMMIYHQLEKVLLVLRQAIVDSRKMYDDKEFLKVRKSERWLFISFFLFLCK